MKLKFLLLFLVAFIAGNAFAQQKKIMLITNPTKTVNGVQAEKAIVDALIALNYDVTTGYNAPSTPANYATYDLIIIGRATTSSDFTNAADWAALTKPVIALSALVVRDSRLKWASASQVPQTGYNQTEANKYSGVVTKVAVVDGNDPAFLNVSVSNGNTNWFNGIYDFLDLNKDEWTTKSNGKLLAYITGDNVYTPNPSAPTTPNNKIIAARWSPGVVTYTSSGITPQGYRSLITIGSEVTGVTPANWLNYTPESFKLLTNEIESLLYNYTVAASANNATMGSVSGTGTFIKNWGVTLTATASSGYRFVNWSESGTQVSTDASYTFAATANRTLVANFEQDLGTGLDNSASQASVRIYPIPAVDGVFNLKSEGLKGVFTLKITDISGKVVYHRNFSEQTNISVNTGLKAGVYQLTVSDGNKTISSKLVCN